MTKIKLCGLSRPADIQAANAARPDYIGFVFAKSRRQVGCEQAKALKRLLDPGIQTVGVFVNAPLEEILCLGREGIIQAVQLHGDENAAYMQTLKKQLRVPVIRAVRVRSAERTRAAERLPCDFLLLDTFQPDTYGGSGKRFDWSLIPPLKKPYFLAGGLNMQNIRQAAALHPYCLDVSSGAETDGRKDRDKMIKLVDMIRRNE